jgi:hypothetical protein
VLAIGITKLWILGHLNYVDHLSNMGFYMPGFINGALYMSVALLMQMVLGAVHPPGSATALAVATDPTFVAPSWHYLLAVLVGSFAMLVWVLVINNLGRRRHPKYWWSPGEKFVEAVGKELKILEEGHRNGSFSYGKDVEAIGEEIA